MLRERSLLAAMDAMHKEVGPAYEITLPGFRPAVFVGPESNRQILVSEREHFNWRNEKDPVTRLLRHGLLVEDGDQHACLRGVMEPVLQKRKIVQHVPRMIVNTDRVLDSWNDGAVLEMLAEMRRVALLVFTATLFDIDFDGEMERLWRPILRTLKYIAPGLWIVWPDIPRPGYADALHQMDEFLFRIIRERRNDPRGDDDLLGRLIRVPEMDDDLIRDQLLTMLIAGHDTSTALLAWALHLLGRHPQVLRRAKRGIAEVLGNKEPTAGLLKKMTQLDLIIKESLRLYPPIHVGNRILNDDANVAGYALHAGQRVMVSIYLSHRDKRYWDEPEKFRPQRFAKGEKRPPSLTYIPFGAGPRNCIGAAFAQVEAKAVLARILQRFDLIDTGREVRTHMGATLEPRPGVFLQVKVRQ